MGKSSYRSFRIIEGAFRYRCGGIASRRAAAKPGDRNAVAALR